MVENFVRKHVDHLCVGCRLQLSLDATLMTWWPVLIPCCLCLLWQYLDCLWAQIKNLQNNKWMEKQILRPYIAFDGLLCEALQHTLPQIIPPSHHEDATYPLPSVLFRMFDYTDVPEVGISLCCMQTSHTASNTRCSRGRYLLMLYADIPHGRQY